jgi:preprotein translocase subunit YajC
MRKKILFSAAALIFILMFVLTGCMGTGSGGSGEGGSGSIVQFLPLIAIFAVMYFVMIRPQRKKQKQVEEMRSNVKTGDRITTIGGLRGRVVRVADDVITIEVGSDKVRMDFMKWAVSKVDEKGAPKSRSEERASEPEKEEAPEPEAEAPKTVKKPRRLGFKSDSEADGENNK